MGIGDDVAAWMEYDNMIKILEMITDSLPREKANESTTAEKEETEGEK